MTFDGAKQVLVAVDNMPFLKELCQQQGMKKTLSYWSADSFLYQLRIQLSTDKVLHRVKEESNILRTIERRKAN